MKVIEIDTPFTHRTLEPRFFVRALDEHDPERNEGFQYEIQFLNEDCSSGKYVLLREREGGGALELGIPKAVLEAAYARETGGEFVNDHGQSCCPF